MIRRPPRATRTDTLFPYTTLFRSCQSQCLLSIGLLLNRNRTAITLGVVAEVLIQSPTANRAGHPVSKPSRIAHSLHHLEGAGSLRRFKEIRSEERRVGKKCVSTCSTRWSQYH